MATTTAAARSSAPTRRVVWVDALKGLFVVLVVLHHMRTGLEDAGARLPGLAGFEAAVFPVTMPGMMLLSGLFARNALRGPSHRLWRDRVGDLIYLSILWLVISVVVAVLAALALHRPTDVAAIRVGLRLLDGVQPLWFLLALAAFFAYAQVVRRLPIAVQFAGAATVAVLVLLAPDFPGLFERLWLLGFFLIGAHFANLLDRAVAVSGFEWLMAGRVGAACAWVGARTLPIFLVHAVFLPVALRMVPANVAGALLGTVALILASLACRTASAAIPGLWTLPATWRPRTVSSSSA